MKDFETGEFDLDEYHPDQSVYPRASSTKMKMMNEPDDNYLPADQTYYRKRRSRNATNYIGK
jgi:hypothetical protein